MPGEKEKPRRKRTHQQPPNSDIPVWVLQKLEVPTNCELMTVESRWMFQVKGTELHVSRVENKAVHKEIIDISKLSLQPILLAELVAWMNFTLAIEGQLEDIVKIVAEVEAYLDGYVKQGQCVGLYDFAAIQNNIFGVRGESELTLDFDFFHGTLSAGDTTSTAIFNNLFTATTFCSFLKRPFYKNLSESSKIECMHLFAQLYYWTRYRIHTLAKHVVQKAKDTPIFHEELQFHFLKHDFLINSTHLKTPPDFQPVTAYLYDTFQEFLSQLSEKILTIGKILGFDGFFVTQADVLLSHIIFDFTQGLRILKNIGYPSIHSEKKQAALLKNGSMSPHIFAYHSSHEQTNASPYLEKKTKNSFGIHLRQLPLAITGETITMAKSIGTCPHPERATTIQVCPHRKNE